MFKKNIEQIYRNVCLLMCKFVVIAYISVQNILFYEGHPIKNETFSIAQ